MSHLAIYLLALAAQTHALAPNGGLQDLSAFPKYQIEFLNHLPLSASDAAIVQRLGMAHEDEFLQLHPRHDTIDGDGNEEPNRETEVALVPLQYTPPGVNGRHSYLCALPSSNTSLAQMAASRQHHDEPEPDPEASWAALSHLNGRCLYQQHVLQWFTYSYCHNSHVKQFREKGQIPPHAEGYEPVENTEYKSYTLGVAQPASARKDVRKIDGKGSEQTSSFGVSPASRYLVQRWSDGTRCDKTGKPREIEIQVHCSMASADMIYMVKEIQTCQYVMIIHSPHLCSLPGFRPFTDDDVAPAPVRCREVVTDEDFEEWYKTKDEREEREGFLQLPEREGREGQGEEQEQGEEEGKSKAHGLGEVLAGLGRGRGVDEATMRDIETLVKNAFGAGAVVEGLDFGDDEEQLGELGEVDPDAPMYVIKWKADDEGNVEPAEVDSLPSTSGEERRAFLERLQAIIKDELEQPQSQDNGKSDTKDKSSGTKQDESHDLDDKAKARDEL